MERNEDFKRLLKYETHFKRFLFLKEKSDYDFFKTLVTFILRQIKKKTYLINQMKVRNDSIDTCEKHFGLMAWVDGFYG